ncbi:hypothetical protein B0H14DRAFT_2583477 [Mycena olivaceomarginata]|nr:hypothetical protein B0H14DRAFT_2583477 [Mycena olivaceomarginata]
MPPKADLHQPYRNIQDLTPYEHLWRVFRVCTVHNFRNIKKCGVSEEVRWLMRSLVCVEHDNWDNTLAVIRQKGGKAGNDWVNDKESSQFFFPGICWERSFILLDIWNAGDSNSNLIESVHSDVNREGGLQKGRLFDALKMKTLNTYEEYGITPSYKTGHISENAYSNLKRKANSQHRVLAVEDQKIERYNEKLLKSLDTLAKAEKASNAKQQEFAEEQRPEKRQKIEGELEKKQRAEERARKAFEKQHAERNLLSRGSGKIAPIECIEPYSVFVLALALTKDVEWRGSATKLERGCSSFIVFWETGLHSTQTDEGTAAETWLRWAGVMQQMRPSGQVHVMQYWAGWIASLVAERALDLFHAAAVRRRRHEAVVLGYGCCVPSTLRGFVGA